jgi:hypothetical protein
MQTNLVSFVVFFFIHTQHLRVDVLSFFVSRICTSIWFFFFPSNPPGVSVFGAYFGGIGVGVLLENCDSSDDEPFDTCIVVCVIISHIVTTFHCSLCEYLVMGHGIVAICCLYKFVWLTTVSVSSGVM